MTPIDDINAYLQRRLAADGLMEVSAVHAARWLDESALLKDSSGRPGLPLRNLLRDGRIAGADRRSAGAASRWFIRRIAGPAPHADAVFKKLREMPGWTRDPRTGEARRDRTWLFWPSGVPGCRWGVFVNENGAGAQLTIELADEDAEQNKRVLRLLRSGAPNPEDLEWFEEDGITRTRVRLLAALGEDADATAVAVFAAATALQMQLDGPLAAAVPHRDEARQEQDAVDQVLRPRRQGRGLSPEARRAVEQRAVSVVSALLAEEGWAVEDVGATHSYDLDCSRGAEHLWVEVKGTTGDLRTVVLTANEVALAAAQHPATALFVIYGIVLDRSRPALVARGGSVHAVRPWQADEARLTPTAFTYRL